MPCVLRRSTFASFIVVVIAGFALSSPSLGAEPATIPEALEPAKSLKPLHPKLLAKLEAELARLQKESDADNGPERPPPSEELAYYLLRGAAVGRTPVTKLTEDEKRQFGFVPERFPPENVMYDIGPDARIYFGDQWIQDKSGSYALRRAILIKKQNGKWLPAGSGTIAYSDD